MTALEFIEAAAAAKPSLTAGELVILGCAWLRVSMDGEDPVAVARWTNEFFEPPVQDLQSLKSRGLSLREIAHRTGISKSTIARRLSQKAA